MAINRKHVAELAAKGKKPTGSKKSSEPVESPSQALTTLIAFLEDAERTVSVIEAIAARGNPPDDMEPWGFALSTLHGKPMLFRFETDPATLKARAVEALGRAEVHRGIMAKRVRAGGNISAEKRAIDDRLERVVRVLANFINTA
jgi:hypothetical protein